VGACTPVTGAGSGGRRTIAWGGRRGACHQAVYDRGGTSRGGASSRHGGAHARGGGGWRRGGGRAGRARDVGGDLEEEEAGLLLLEVRSCLSRGRVPNRRGSDDLFPCPQGGANRAPLAPAKVLRVDASVPTRRRSLRALRAGTSTAATASGASRGATEASGRGRRQQPRSHDGRRQRRDKSRLWLRRSRWWRRSQRRQS
jgi:hypothetical protein